MQSVGFQTAKIYFDHSLLQSREAPTKGKQEVLRGIETSFRIFSQLVQRCWTQFWQNNGMRRPAPHSKINL